MEVKEVVKALLASGAKKIEGVTVKNVTVTVTETYTRCALTLDKEVEGYVQDRETGEWKKSNTNVVFVSLFSLVSILKNNAEAAFAANHIVENPKGIGVVMSRAKIDIIQEPVISGQEYKNPWTTREDAEANVFDHDTIINHVVDIEISDFGNELLKGLAFKLMGI